MDLDNLMYGYKKEASIIIASPEYSETLEKLISKFKTPITFKIHKFDTVDKIIDFVKKEEVVLIIMDENVNFREVISEIRALSEYERIQFMVVLNQIPLEVELPVENVNFILKEMLNETLFNIYYRQSLMNYFYEFQFEQSLRKIRKIRHLKNRERLYLNSVVNEIKEGVIILNEVGEILFANKPARHILELEGLDYLNTPADNYLQLKKLDTNEIDGSLLEFLTNRERIKNRMSKLETKAGRNYIVNYEIAPLIEYPLDRVLGGIFIFEDVTLQKRLLEDISKKKNLEIIGLIAEGFVHDLNNQLTTMLANIHLLKESCPEELSEDLIYDYLLDIENACIKSKGIIMDFISFSKGGIPLKKKGNIKELVEEVVHLMFRGSNIRVDISAESNLWYIEFDHSLMAQAIKNILTNSKEAISHGGNIIIKIGNQFIPENNPYNVKEGKYVKISIEDDGVGIPKQFMDKIFDPNFSTKGFDRGLGLSIVNSIISNHNGFIKIDSRENVGTSVNIYLPVTEEKTQEEKKVTKIPKKPSRIIVIERDKEILKTLEKVFKFLELNAEYISNARLSKEDIEKFTKLATSYDYILIDTSNVDERNVLKLIGYLKEMNPELKVIIMTHLHRFDADRAKRFMANAILYKPFGVEEIGEILGSVID